MIDTDKIENMKQWTNDYKVRMFWDLVTEVKRLREGIKTYLENATSACNEVLKLKELIE